MKVESINALAICCSLAACGEPDRTPDPLPQTVASNVAGPATSTGTGGFSTTGISESYHTTAGFVPAGGTAGAGGSTAVGSGGLPNTPSRQQHDEPAGRGVSLELRYALFR